MLIGYIFGAFVAFIGLLIQVRPRLSNRYFGIDTWRHLTVADYIRQNKKYPKLMPEHYLIDKPSDYPPLFRFLLALFPKELLEKYQWIASPIFDLIHNLFIFSVVYYFTNNIFISILAQVTYMLSPIVIMENSNLTTRSFASLLFSGCFFSLICYSVFGNIFCLIASIIFLTILLLSHRMSIQAMVFILVFFSIIELNFIYVAVLLASVILAILFSKGFYLKVLKGHLAMIRFWFIHIDNRYAHQIRGVSKKEKNPDAVFRIYQIVQNIPFIAVCAANPFMVFVFAYVYLNLFKSYNINTFGIPEDIFSKFVVWSILLFVIGVIVRQVKKLGCIGEGERYLEYSAFPVAIIIAVFLTNGLISGQHNVFLVFYLIVAIFGALLPTLFIQQQVIVKDSKRSVNKEIREIFGYINALEGKVNVMTMPLYLADAATYFTSARLLTTDNSIAHVVDYSDFWPVLKVPLVDIFKRYDINYILINTQYVQISELNLPSNQIVKESGFYCLIKVDLI